MIILLSPAKTMDFHAPCPVDRWTQPRLLDAAGDLVQTVAALERAELQELMKVSRQLADQTHARFSNWRRGAHDSPGEALQAVAAYRGEVYRGFDTGSLTPEDAAYAQRHLRILSGLYGVLRPLDLILPYRLEMATPLPNCCGENLYDFWGNRIAEVLEADALEVNTSVFINLASQEYLRAVRIAERPISVITPVFKDLRNGKPRVVGMYAKKQRGRLARYIVDQRVTDPAAIKDYRDDGYAFSQEHSTATQWVFLRSR